MIELLTVIAIIAVLAAILIPGVAMVRNRANAAGEVNNLRQIGVAVQMYTSENDGYYPFLNMVPDEISTPGASPDDFWNVQLSKYLPHTISMEDQQSVFQSPMVPRENRHPISDYGANMFVFLDANPGNSARATQRKSVYSIADPAKTVAVATAWYRPAGDRPGGWVGSWMIESYTFVNSGQAANMPHPRLPSLPSAQASASRMEGEVGVVFCDGHVDTIEWSTLRDNRAEYFETN